MSQGSDKIRYVLQYYFDRDHYCEGALSKSAAEKCFTRFRSGNLYVKFAPRSGRQIVEKIDAVLQKNEEDRHISSYDVTAKDKFESIA